MLDPDGDYASVLAAQKRNPAARQYRVAVSGDDDNPEALYSQWLRTGWRGAVGAEHGAVELQRIMRGGLSRRRYQSERRVRAGGSRDRAEQQHQQEAPSVML